MDWAVLLRVYIDPVIIGKLCHIANAVHTLFHVCYKAADCYFLAIPDATLELVVLSKSVADYPNAVLPYFTSICCQLYTFAGC